MTEKHCCFHYSRWYITLFMATKPGHLKSNRDEEVWKWARGWLVRFLDWKSLKTGWESPGWFAWAHPPPSRAPVPALTTPTCERDWWGIQKWFLFLFRAFRHIIWVWRLISRLLGIETSPFVSRVSVSVSKNVVKIVSVLTKSQSFNFWYQKNFLPGGPFLSKYPLHYRGIATEFLRYFCPKCRFLYEKRSL